MHPPLTTTSIPQSPHKVLKLPVAGPGAVIIESLLFPTAVVVNPDIEAVPILTAEVYLISTISVLVLS